MTAIANDIDVLLRIKRAREQRAEIAARQAQAACLRARKAHGRAEVAVTDYAAARPAEEAAIYRSLTVGPIAAYELRRAAARLSEIAAQAEVLRQRLVQAEQHEAACDVASDAARGLHAAASREVLGASAARARLDLAAYAVDERRQDAELEEVAGRCRRESLV
jgi:hypothetical protein